jgi:hypothetical protein
VRSGLRLPSAFSPKKHPAGNRHARVIVATSLAYWLVVLFGAGALYVLALNPMMRPGPPRSEGPARSGIDVCLYVRFASSAALVWVYWTVACELALHVGVGFAGRGILAVAALLAWPTYALRRKASTAAPRGVSFEPADGAALLGTVVAAVTQVLLS